MKHKNNIVVIERIEQKILLIRGKKVMLDRDLAKLYNVPTRILNQAVRRNISRFPQDFMFQLTKSEFKDWKSQIVTSNSDKMGLRKRPLAFTEHGILMLSSVLNSERAIKVNIHIMRVFTRLRELMIQHKDLEQRINALERKCDRKFKSIFEAIRQLLEPPLPPPQPRIPIGFHAFQKPAKGKSSFCGTSSKKDHLRPND